MRPHSKTTGSKTSQIRLVIDHLGEKEQEGWKKTLYFNFYIKENKKISPIKKISTPQATVSLILFFAREKKFHLFKASTK